MTQQTINVGAVSGDGTGDPGRTAFTKVNTMFSDLYAGAVYFGSDTGAANAYVVTLGSLRPPPASVVLILGVVVHFYPSAANTGAATLNFAASGPIPILGLTGAPLVGGEIPNATPVWLQYTGSNWQLLFGVAVQTFAQGTLAPPTISSATTIAPTAPISFVSGVTTIATITPPPSIVGVITNYGGQITLIPTGLWSTNTAGNIALATTAVVNKALILSYDSVSAKWYPSY